VIVDPSYGGSLSCCASGVLWFGSWDGLRRSPAPYVGLTETKNGATAARRGKAFCCLSSTGTTLGSCRCFGSGDMGDELGMTDDFMRAAIEEARRGAAESGIPIGSVLVYQGRIIGRGHNQRVQRGSSILHGEMDALENAGRQSAAVYREAALYTTLSPCPMCSGAILLYRIPRVVIGENRTYVGDEELLRSRRVSVDVLQDSTCRDLMASFIRTHPELWNEDIGV
jgi:cytosine/creatinine deaminase